MLNFDLCLFLIAAHQRKKWPCSGSSAAGNVDLNTISTVVAGVLTSLQSTSNVPDSDLSPHAIDTRYAAYSSIDRVNEGGHYSLDWTTGLTFDLKCSIYMKYSVADPEILERG